MRPNLSAVGRRVPRRRAPLVLLLLGLTCHLAATPASPQELTPPAWPSLAEQLAADHVVPGSALALLIAVNQDFLLLRPEEVKDTLRLPPWLRVWWRKAHPEGNYSAGDPTGGYPLVLKEILEWMLSHQDLLPGVPEPAISPGAAEPPGEKAALEEKAATVAGEKRISGATTARRSESDVRLNFRDPAKILSASNNISGSGFQAQYWSTDGGSSWGQTTLPPFAGDSSNSDPAVDWTSDGTAWSLTLGIAGSAIRIRAYRSADNGATWSFDATPSGAQTTADKELLWVDHGDSSPFKDNLYAIWHAGSPVFIARRTGPTGSWQPPIQVSGAETIGTGIGADVKTNGFGDVFGFWPDTLGAGLYVVKSTDGGASFGAPVALATTFGSYTIGIPAMNRRRALIYVSGGAYRTASEDLVYAVWTDLSGAAGCQGPNDEPGARVTAACTTRIWFARSLDGGATWQAPRKVNDLASQSDQFNPWLAVDEATGALGLIYYDTVRDSGRKATDVWFQASLDRGVNWGTAVKVSAAPTDETDEGADTGNQYGDYNGLSGYAGTFFPSWTDRRGGGATKKEEVWSAAVACGFRGAPAIGTATAPADDQIRVSWGNGSPASASFNVYRAQGTCAAPGPFTRIATGVAGSSYLDTTVHGTVTYAYRVTGGAEAGACESAASACVEATATGPCDAPPDFPGLAAIANSQSSTCSLQMVWGPATVFCGGPARYDVFRSTLASFTPGPANRIATGIAGTAYTDASPLASGTTYYYVVRALDSANGAGETNTVRRNAAPSGPLVGSSLTDTFEGTQSGGGFDQPGWSHAAVGGSIDWAPSTAFSHTATHSWLAASQGSPSDRTLTSPPFGIQAGTTLTFRHTFAFEGTVAQCHDGGTLEITTDGGATWSVLPDDAYTGGTGYNGTINPFFGNPLAGEHGWCAGTLGAMTAVTADLSAFNGATARLRWHAGDDQDTGTGGWYVDTVQLANTTAATACTPGAGPGADFYTVTPCRLLDTRNPAGPNGGPALQPGQERTFTIAGACGVPATAKAVSLNLTIVQPTAAGNLTLFPADQTAPLASAISFKAGAIRANNAVLGLSSAGALKVKAATTGTVHFILDVNGYLQ